MDAEGQSRDGIDSEKKKAEKSPREPRKISRHIESEKLSPGKNRRRRSLNVAVLEEEGGGSGIRTLTARMEEERRERDGDEQREEEDGEEEKGREKSGGAYIAGKDISKRTEKIDLLTEREKAREREREREKEKEKEKEKIREKESENRREKDEVGMKIKDGSQVLLSSFLSSCNSHLS